MYYVLDETRKNDRGNGMVFHHEDVASVVAHLEDIAPRLLNKTRNEVMADAADLGYGADDSLGKTFYEYMSEYVNSGVVREGGKLVRCSIFTDAEFKGKFEHGD